MNQLVFPFQIYAQPIPVVPVAKYLGIAMNTDGVDAVQHVRNLAAKGWAAYGQLQGCGMHWQGFPLRHALPAYKMFVMSTFEYGLALRLFTQKELKPLAAIQNTFITNVLAWWATNVGDALLGLPSIFRHSQELAAWFMACLHCFDEDSLAHCILDHCKLHPTDIPPGSCLTSLFCNSLWRNLDDPAVVSTAKKWQWGQDEHTLLWQTSNVIKLLPSDWKPDVSVISVLPHLVSNAFVAWWVGALTASSRICPSGHRLTHCHVSECVQASQRIQGLDFFVSLELPDQDNSVIDFIFCSSPKKKWTVSDAEVLVLVAILWDVQLWCNQAMYEVVHTE